MPIVIVWANQEGHDKVELHLTSQKPGPIHAHIIGFPWDDIVKEGQMPDPMLLAGVWILVVEKERSISTEKNQESPVEK